MPATAPPARYDLPWKTALTQAFRPFMSFFFPEICARIDWSKRPRFRDKELASMGFSDAPDVVVADKLVEVVLRDGGEWMLIHVEIQAQRDASLARRIVVYNFRISNEYQRPATSLVLLADNDANWWPHAFHRKTLGMTVDVSFPIAKLLDGAGEDSLLASHNPFALVKLAHLHTQQAHHDADKLYAAKWKLTTLLYQRVRSKRRILIFFKVINWMIALPEPYQKRYWRAIRLWEKERKMEWISPLEQSFIDKGWQKGMQAGLRTGRKEGLEEGVKKGREQGLEQGREQGLEQGRTEGAAVLLERLLTRRFGPLPKAARNKLAQASLEQLAAWSDALPEAQSLKQVLG